MITSVPKEVKARIARSLDSVDSQQLALDRGKLFIDVLGSYARSAVTKGASATVDLGKALSTYLHLDSIAGKEVAQERKRAGDTTFAEYIESGKFEKASENIRMIAQGKRAADAIYDGTYDGDGDMADTLVEKSIIDRFEKESPIMNYVFKKNGSGYEKVKFPTLDTDAKVSYKARGSDYTDLSDGTTGLTADLDNEEVEPYDVGGTLDFESTAFAKLDPVFISDLIDKMQKAYIRGVHYELYLGDGSAPNPTGMFTGATSVTYDTDIVATTQKMVATVGDTARTQEGFFIVTNTAGAAAAAANKTNNDAFNININLGKAGLAGSVMGIPVIIDNAVVASGTSPSKTAPWQLGVVRHYAFVEASKPKVEMDVFGDFKSGQQFARIASINGGKPLFADSFAKATIPNVY